MSARKDDESDRGKRTTAEAAALEYASRGWPVFPCSPETKQPLVKGDADPKTGKSIPGTGGLKKATCDEQRIKGWWKCFPKAMIGLPTGKAIGAFVVDIDAGTDSKTGESFEAADILQNLEDQLGVRLPQTWTCRTPRGGLHLYFRVSGSEMPRNRAGLISRVDIRGEGGYVVVPPSSRADGRSYFWESGPPDMPLADAPPELLTLLRNPNAREGAPIQRTRGLRSPSRNYGLSALDSEVLSLENAAEGTRNESLFKSAIKLGQLVAAGQLKESMVRAGLESVIRAWPNQQKSLGTIESGLHRGLREPRGTSALSNGIERPPGQLEGDAISLRFLSSGAHSLGLDEDDQLKLDHELCHRSRTDLGNAERFARRMDNSLIWVSPRGWLHWDGRRWTRTGADEAAKIAAQYVARSIQREADGLRGTDADTVVETRSPGAKFERQIRISDKLADWGRESESDRHLTAVLKQAAPMMAINQSRLDSDPFKINTKNGTLQVARGRSDGDPVSFRPHDPTDLITKVIDADFDPNATCPTYDAFLKMVQPSAQVRRFLHQWAGLALTGDTSEQKLAFFWGKGRNGKTTLTEGWAGIFGDYACSLPIETFMDNGRARSGGQATPDLAILPGIRFVHTDEPARNAKLSESHVKLLTGGDTIQARELNKGFFSFKPEFKLTMSGNYRPKVDGGEASQGTWRRLILIRWQVTIPEDEVDRQLAAKLKAEASGILNRLLDGLRDWLDHGLIIPQEIKEATEHYRRDSDVLGRFLEECTARDERGQISNGELHALFCAWAKSNGEVPWKKKGLTRAMQERGQVQSRSDERYWKDIKTTKLPADFGSTIRPSEIEQDDTDQEDEV